MSKSRPYHTYITDHLITFASSPLRRCEITPPWIINKLFEVEKRIGIKAQRVRLVLQNDVMLIVDGDHVIETFLAQTVKHVLAFSYNQANYRNLLSFLVATGPNQYELHIFQCVSNESRDVQSDLQNWTIAVKTAILAPPRCHHLDKGLGAKEKKEAKGTKVTKVTKGTQFKESTSNQSNVQKAVSAFNLFAVERQKSADNVNGNTTPKGVVLPLAADNKEDNFPRKLQPFRYF